MDGRRDSEERATSGLGFGRRLAIYYVSAGAVLAVLRIALIAWGDHHQGTFLQWNLYWVFYPEELLYWHTDFRPTGLLRRTALFFVGSYVLATPVLAAGWLLNRPRLVRHWVVRYLTCGAALAIVRIAVLVSASGVRAQPEWHRRWIFFPEALLLIHTRLGDLGWYDFRFVLATLMAVGSYVLVAPILLVGWLRRTA